jgi:hypothetical protein
LQFLVTPGERRVLIFTHRDGREISPQRHEGHEDEDTKILTLGSEP